MSETPKTTAAGNSGSITDRVASVAHESIDRVTPKANSAEAELRDTAARTAESARQLEEQAMDTARNGLHKVQAYIEENPLMSAGIALTTGMLISMLIPR